MMESPINTKEWFLFPVKKIRPFSQSSASDQKRLSLFRQSPTIPPSQLSSTAWLVANTQDTLPLKPRKTLPFLKSKRPSEETIPLSLELFLLRYTPVRVLRLMLTSSFTWVLRRILSVCGVPMQLMIKAIPLLPASRECKCHPPCRNDSEKQSKYLLLN